MKKSLVIILIALLSSVAIYANDNVEQMATTLGNSGQPTVGTNLLLNIKPKAVTKSVEIEDLTGSNANSSVSIIGGQVKKGNSNSSGSVGGIAGAGINNFNSGRSSSVSNTSTTLSSTGSNGPRRVGPGNIGDPGTSDTPIGTMPFAFIILLAIGYGLYKKSKFES